MRGMRWLQASLAVLIGVVIVACGGVQVGGPPAGGDGPQPNAVGGDRKPAGGDKQAPAAPVKVQEKPGVEAVQRRKGQFKQDTTLPGNPVVEVNLNFTKTTDADLKDLAGLPRLRKLTLSQNPLTGTGLADLAGLEHLEHLDVGFCKQFSDDGLKAIAKLKSLKYLYVSSNEWTDEGLKALAALEHLEDVTLAGGAVKATDAGFAAVSALPRLRRVDYNNCNAGDLTCKALSQGKHLRVVSMYGTSISDRGVADLAKLMQLEELKIGYGVYDEGVKALTALKNLRKLSLWNCRAGDEGLLALAGMANLQELDASTQHATGEGIAALRKALPQCKIISDKKGGEVSKTPKLPPVSPQEKPGVESVRRLKGRFVQDTTRPGNPVVEVNLNFTKTTDADLKDLAGLPQLRKLILTQNPLTGTGLAGLQHLEHLDVSFTALTDDGLKAIAKLRPLKWLRVYNNLWGDAGVKELAALENLEELTLGANGKTTDAAFAEAVGGMPRLRRVDFDNSGAGDLTARVLSERKDLRAIVMYGTRITDKGVADLAKLTQLEELLVGYGVADEGAKAIAKLTGLKKLSLWNTSVTDKGLLELHGLKNLREFDAPTSFVTQAGIDALRKALPQCKVEWRK